MLMCPGCQGPTRVYDTRRRKDGNVMRRRRCSTPRCYSRFVTLERVARIVGDGGARAPERPSVPLGG